MGSPQKHGIYSLKSIIHKKMPLQFNRKSLFRNRIGLRMQLYFGTSQTRKFEYFKYLHSPNKIYNTIIIKKADSVL